MLKQIIVGMSAGFLSISVWAANSAMQIKTSLGNIEIELFNDKAPMSVKNFESYVKSNFYNGTIFHRVIPGFMIQGGGFNAHMKQKPTNAPVRNEASNGLKNTRGTLAMARTNDPNSATSQFFINIANNDFLNRNIMNDGYAVFGRVTQGMEIVDKIAAVPTGNNGPYQNVPVQPVKILEIKTKVNKTDK